MEGLTRFFYFRFLGGEMWVWGNVDGGFLMNEKVGKF
jgi:hypothetical protein